MKCDCRKCNMVSVIIPCFNGENTIDDAIKSVFQQQYGMVELVVVDDGSTDRSAEKIKKWIPQFHTKGWTLKYIYEDNRGLGGAIDTGLKHIEGVYLTILDDDDVFLSGAISKKAEFLNNNSNYSLVRNNGYYVRSGKKSLFINNDYEKQENLFDLLIEGKTNNWAGTYMIRTDHLFSIYPDKSIYPSRFGQNYQLLLASSYKSKCGYIDEPLMEYRAHSDSHSSIEGLGLEEKHIKEELLYAQWKDIFIHVISTIEKDENRRARIIACYEEQYAKNELKRAYRYNDIKQLKTSWNKIKRKDLQDCIYYYRLIQ